MTLFCETLFHNSRIPNLLWNFNALCCGYCAVSPLWVSSSYFLLQILHPVLVLVFFGNYYKGTFRKHWNIWDGPFRNVVCCWDLLNKFTKSSLLDVYLPWKYVSAMIPFVTEKGHGGFFTVNFASPLYFISGKK